MAHMRDIADEFEHRTERIREQVGEARERLSEAAEKVRDTAEEVKDRGEEVWDDAVAFVKKHPAKAVGLTLLIGFAFGALMSPRRRD